MDGYQNYSTYISFRIIRSPTKTLEAKQHQEKERTPRKKSNSVDRTRPRATTRKASTELPSVRAKSKKKDSTAESEDDGR